MKTETANVVNFETFFRKEGIQIEDETIRNMLPLLQLLAKKCNPEYLNDITSFRMFLEGVSSATLKCIGIVKHCENSNISLNELETSLD